MIKGIETLEKAMQMAQESGPWVGMDRVGLLSVGESASDVADGVGRLVLGNISGDSAAIIRRRYLAEITAQQEEKRLSGLALSE